MDFKNPTNLVAGSALLASITTSAYLTKQMGEITEQVDEIKNHLTSAIAEIKSEKDSLEKHENHIAILGRAVKQLNELKKEQNYTFESIIQSLNERGKTVDMLISSVSEIQDILIKEGKLKEGNILETAELSIGDIENNRHGKIRGNRINLIRYEGEHLDQERGRSMTRSRSIDEDFDIQSSERNNKNKNYDNPDNRHKNYDNPDNRHKNYDDYDHRSRNHHDYDHRSKNLDDHGIRSKNSDDHGIRSKNLDDHRHPKDKSSFDLDDELDDEMENIRRMRERKLAMG